jgi:hypothetical protein
MYSIGVFWRSRTTVLTAVASTKLTYLAPSLAMTSASVVERAVVFCSRLVQDTAPSAITAITHMVELLVALSPAKSASLKTFSSSEPKYT